MTVYVRGVPCAERGVWYLWADTPDEAMLAASSVGACILGSHRPDRAPGHYDLTTEQWAQALLQGAQIRPLVDAWTNAARVNGRKDLLAPQMLDGLSGIA